MVNIKNIKIPKNFRENLDQKQKGVKKMNQLKKWLLVSAVGWSSMISAAELGDQYKSDEEDRFSQVSGGSSGTFKELEFAGEQWDGVGGLPRFCSSVPLEKLCSAFAKVVVEKKNRIAFKKIEKAAEEGRLAAKGLLAHVLLQETSFQEKTGRSHGWW